jgi:antitoxin ParD1/3/4
MVTMNISLPADLKDFVDTQVSKGGYTSSSEFIRALIRRQRDESELRAMILKGTDSPPEGVFDPPTFNSLRSRMAAGLMVQSG